MPKQIKREESSRGPGTKPPGKKPALEQEPLLRTRDGREKHIHSLLKPLMACSRDKTMHLINDLLEKEEKGIGMAERIPAIINGFSQEELSCYLDRLYGTFAYFMETADNAAEEAEGEIPPMGLQIPAESANVSEREWALGFRLIMHIKAMSIYMNIGEKEKTSACAEKAADYAAESENLDLFARPLYLIAAYFSEDTERGEELLEKKARAKSRIYGNLYSLKNKPTAYQEMFNAQVYLDMLYGGDNFLQFAHALVTCSNLLIEQNEFYLAALNNEKAALVYEERSCDLAAPTFMSTSKLFFESGTFDGALMAAKAGLRLSATQQDREPFECMITMLQLLQDTQEPDKS